MTIPTLFEEAAEPAVQETTPQNPATTEQLRLERVMATAVSEKEQLRQQYAETRAKGVEIQGEIDKIEAAIRTAEHKSQILSAPRSDYINARAEQISRGLMGESVELSTIERSGDFAASLSAVDLAEGLRTLKKRRDELVGGFGILKGRVRSIAIEYYKQHAIQHGARFEMLRSEIASEFIQLQAAHKLNLPLSGFNPILLDSMPEMVLPGIDGSEAMIPLRKYPLINSREITGNALAMSGAVDRVTKEINRELEGK